MKTTNLSSEKIREGIQKDGSLVLRYWDHQSYLFIPANHAKIIAQNLCDGHPYHAASPLYSLTKQELAFIHANAARWIQKEK